RRIDLSREETCAQRCERNEADAELLAGREHAVALGVSRPERVLALDGGERQHRVRTSDGRRARLREPEVPHLSRGDQRLDRAGDVLDRNVAIDAMLEEEI